MRETVSSDKRLIILILFDIPKNESFMGVIPAKLHKTTAFTTTLTGRLYAQ